MYNFVLMVGKSSLKSSHRMQSNAVLEGLGIGLQIWSWPNLCEKSLRQVFLLAKVLVSKTFCVVFGESYYLPRSIKAAPYFLSRLMSRNEKNKAIWKPFTLSESYEQFLCALVCFTQAIKH